MMMTEVVAQEGPDLATEPTGAMVELTEEQIDSVAGGVAPFVFFAAGMGARVLAPHVARVVAPHAGSIVKWAAGGISWDILKDRVT